MNDARDAVEHDPAGGSHVEGGVVEHPNAEDFGNATALPADPTWFKHAVFYEVLVRAFFDANADGSGDLRGLIGPPRLPAVARHRLHLAAPVLRLAAA